MDLVYSQLATFRHYFRGKVTNELNLFQIDFSLGHSLAAVRADYY